MKTTILKLLRPLAVISVVLKSVCSVRETWHVVKKNVCMSGTHTLIVCLPTYTVLIQYS